MSSDTPRPLTHAIVRTGRELRTSDRQRLTGACIGSPKQRLKSLGQVVPGEARQAFAKLHDLGHDNSGTPWNKVIGLHNALVHDYLNLDAGIVEGVIRQRDYRRLLDFAEAQLREK